MRHRAALLSAVLAMAAATLIMPGRAAAVEPGFRVDITELPETFTAGAGARTVTVVASSEQNRCQKVRWSMLIAVDGPALNDVEVARIEDGGDFPVRVGNAGESTARITDVGLDPGQLCRGRTVTARYRIGFDDDAASGPVTFRVQAFNAGRTLLQEASSRSEVRGEPAQPQESESPSAEPSPSAAKSSPAPEESADDEDTAAPQPTGTRADLAAVPAAGAGGGTPSLLGAGLVVGGILVFLGVGLLLRLRLRARPPKHSAPLPTGFYPTN